MPPAVAAVATIVAGFVIKNIVIYVVVVLLINMAAASYARHHQPTFSDPADNRRLVSRSSVSPTIILYGERRLGGTMVYWATGGGAKPNAPPKSLCMVLCLTQHEINSIGDVYLGDTLSTDPSIPVADTFEKFTGASGQTVSTTVQQYNVSGEPWTTSFTGDSVAYLVIVLDSYEDWDRIPDVSTVCQGSKIYDPRKDSTNGGSGSHRYTDPSTWEYSNNPALIARDYLTRDEGFGEDHIKIDDAFTIASANTCDIWEAVPEDEDGTDISFDSASSEIRDVGATLPVYSVGTPILISGSSSNNGNHTVLTSTSAVLTTTGSPAIVTEAAGSLVVVSERQPRYSCDLALSLTQSRKENLLQILETMYGEVVYVGGEWKIMAGEFTTPTFTIIEDDIVGSFAIGSSTSASNLYNSVSGTYYDSKRFYQQVSFKQRDNAGYVSRDGGREVTREIRLIGVTDEYQAQRLATFELNQSEHQTLVTFIGKPRLLDLHVNMMVKLTLDNPAWTDKPFRVLSWELQKDLTVSITLRDENSGAWDSGLGIYNQVQSHLQYNPYIPRLVDVPTNFRFFTGGNISKETAFKLSTDAIRGGYGAYALLRWEDSPDDQLAGYRIKWRETSSSAGLSDAIAEMVPIVSFAGNENDSNPDAINDSIREMVGVYGTNTDTSGMSGATLNPFESGIKSINVAGDSDRVLDITTPVDEYPTDEFSMVTLFSVATATADTTIVGQWGSTDAKKGFRFGTMEGSTNIGVTVYDSTGTKREIDSGAVYDGDVAHIAVISKRDDKLILEIDGAPVGEYNFTGGDTMNWDQTEDLKIGGGSVGAVHNGRWSNALVTNRHMDEYERENAYNLWATGDVAIGKANTWNRDSVGETERSWTRRLTEGRTYDFELEAFNKKGLYSSPIALIGKTVLGATTPPKESIFLSAIVTPIGNLMTLNISSVVARDLAYVEWAYSTVNDRDDSVIQYSSVLTEIPSGARGFPNYKKVSQLIGKVVQQYLVFTGVNYVWARIINSSDQTGDWNTGPTAGLEVVGGEPASGIVNLIPTNRRAQISVSDGHVFHQTNASNSKLILADHDIAENDYMSCSVWVDRETATECTLTVEFFDSIDDLIVTDPLFEFNHTPVPVVLTRTVLEGILVPVGAVTMQMRLETVGGTVLTANPVLNEGLTVLRFISPWGDRFLDPDDDGVYLDVGDYQNLLDGQVEAPVEDSPTVTTASGGPFKDPELDEGGWYDRKFSDPL